jgi:hypothetical protein
MLKDTSYSSDINRYFGDKSFICGLMESELLMMNKLTQKRIDAYDIGDGLVLLNVITKNEQGKMHQIDTYIGIESNGFVCVGNARELDAPGAIFSYKSYVRMQETNLTVLKDIFETNTGVK